MFLSIAQSLVNAQKNYCFKNYAPQTVPVFLTFTKSFSLKINRITNIVFFYLLLLLVMLCYFISINDVVATIAARLTCLNM